MIEKFQKDISGIIWLSGSFFLALSLLSYSPTDPSLNSTGSRQAVQNLCGYFGSFLSDILYQTFGIAAWLLVFVGTYRAYKIFKNQSRSISKERIFIGALFVLVCCSLGALYFGQAKIFSNAIHVGGLLGLFATKGLIGVFNKTGVSIILWSMLAVLSVFFTEKSLKEILQILIPRKMARYLRDAAYAARLLFKKREPSKLEARPAPIVENKSFSAMSIQEMAEEIPPQKIMIQTLEEKKEKYQRESIRREKKVENWILPKLSILEPPPSEGFKVDEKNIKRNTFLLEDKLSQFSVNGQVVAVRPGPAVTMYEFKPNADVKISKITELADDLSLALSSESIRIIAPLPGRDVVGIETSNPKRESVLLSEIIEDRVFWDEKTKLPIALGKEANGEPKTVDLRKMPHLLVAGTTGSGKSVFINTLLTGLLFKHSPKTLRLILVDPKQVDLAAFHSIPHLIMPPIKEPKKAVTSLKWAIREMDKRYRSMSKFNVKGLEAFNERIENLSSQETSQHQAYNEELEQQNRGSVDGYYFSAIPYIVIVVEEFGDLMAVDKANVEQLIVRLAQMARACGIHLILAMQSPRRDVVTGLIKTNIPGRISFKVASKMDSRIILDESGAERLLAQGDMLFLAPGVSKPQRHHGAWVSEKEIAELTEFWSKQSEPEYDPSALKAVEGAPLGQEFLNEDGDGFYLDPQEDVGMDEKYDELLAYVSGLREVSASLLQRRFRLGYPRAARLIEIFEKEGVVGPANGSKPRQVLVNKL